MQTPLMRYRFVFSFCVALLATSIAHCLQIKGAAISDVANPSLSPALSDIKRKRLEPRGQLEQYEVKKLPPLPETKGNKTDRALQSSTENLSNIVVMLNVPGLSFSDNSGKLAPPDSTGAAGTNQYVQWVNRSMAVFRKDGTVQYQATDGNTLWSGFGGPCEEWNDGDPIVLFDKLKDNDNTSGRWILTQFAVKAGPPYFECVAVSQTDDATGRYYRYAFKFDLFNDYPKVGVWNDAYYASFNMFFDTGKKDADGRPIFDYRSPRICALERSKMLRGLPARRQCFNTPSRSLLPADVDGPAGPARGSPGIFLDYTTRFLRIWQMKIDWENAKNSTLSRPQEIQVEPFTEACSGEGCISQPDSDQQLDASGDRLLFRLAYRRFGSARPAYESLVVNHTVQVSNADTTSPQSVTAIRWYELRKMQSQTWQIYQQGTFAPDVKSNTPSSRWAGSIAMDKLGNLLIGYSKSGANTYPSIFAAGWSSAHDSLNQLEKETQIQAGAGAVTPGTYRWGDYSTMSVDPDDCTFWFTSQFQPTAGAYTWQTRIVRMRVSDSCRPGKGGEKNGASAHISKPKSK